MKIICQRMDKGHHHDWVSRDYQDIDCRALGCSFNVAGKCATPSACKINNDGKCDGFKAKPLPPVKDGD